MEIPLKCTIAFILVSSMVNVASAKPSSDLSLEMDGRLELEVAARHRQSDFLKQLALDLKVEGDAPFSGVADIEITQEAGDARLRELYLDWDLGGGWVSVGHKKKKFGLDSDYGTKSRLTLNQGMLYRKAGSYSYVGRDSAIELRSASDSETKWSHSVSLHSSEGMTLAGIYYAKLKFNDTWTVRNYALYQASSLAHVWHYSKGIAFAIEGEWKSGRFEAEALAAGDPIETAQLVSTGVNRDIYYFGASIAYSRKTGDWNPFIKVAFLQHDAGNARDRTFEFTPGFKMAVHRSVEIGSELNWLMSPSRHARSTSLPFDSGTTLTIAARYYF